MEKRICHKCKFMVRYTAVNNSDNIIRVCCCSPDDAFEDGSRDLLEVSDFESFRCPMFLKKST